jgi:hypothetical protein
LDCSNGFSSHLFFLPLFTLLSFLSFLFFSILHFLFLPLSKTRPFLDSCSPQP